MKGLRVFGLLLVLMSGTAAAANVHNVTWVRKSVVPGTVVKIGGRDFVLVRLPMKEFTNGNRYIVEYLTDVYDLGPPIVAQASISTSHSDDTIANPVTVSGYPASIYVYDGRTYSYSANTGFDDGLEVDAYVSGGVTLKVGDTLLSLSEFFSAVQQPVTAIPVPFSSASWATWGTYTDPTPLVTNLDNWIDYIRVLKIN
jgi:hypothetical protein